MIRSIRQSVREKGDYKNLLQLKIKKKQKAVRIFPPGGHITVGPFRLRSFPRHANHKQMLHSNI